MDLAVAHPRVAGRRALEPVVVEGRCDFGVAGGAVGVAHEAALLCLDVVAPAHGHVLGAVGDVSGAVLVVLGLVEGGEGAVVHPDAVAFLHRNGVCAVVGLGLAEIDVAYDDVGRADAEDADAVHHEAVGADDAEVGDFLDVEPGVRLAEIPSVVRVESAAEPDGDGGAVALLFALRTGQEPGLECSAVVEVEDVGAACSRASGHACAIAAEGVYGHVARRRRVGAVEFPGRVFRVGVVWIVRVRIVGIVGVIRIVRVVGVVGVVRVVWIVGVVGVVRIVWIVRIVRVVGIVGLLRRFLDHLHRRLLVAALDGHACGPVLVRPVRAGGHGDLVRAGLALVRTHGEPVRIGTCSPLQCGSELHRRGGLSRRKRDVVCVGELDIRLDFRFRRLVGLRLLLAVAGEKRQRSRNGCEVFQIIKTHSHLFPGMSVIMSVLSWCR